MQDLSLLHKDVCNFHFCNWTGLSATKVDTNSCYMMYLQVKLGKLFITMKNRLEKYVSVKNLYLIVSQLYSF